MLRVNRWILHFGAFVVFGILLSTGMVGSASRVHAALDPGGGLYFFLYPENDDVNYACVGKPITGFFIVRADANDPTPSDPLTPLVPPQIGVNTSDPLMGTLSKRAWTINANLSSRWFTYTPTKTGDEDLVFTASLANSSAPPIEKHAKFPVIYCGYRVSIHSEISNTQGTNGKIDTNIFYDGEGHFDLSRPDRNSAWTIIGYGTTTFEAYVDGTEGDVTCVTTSPGKGSGTLLINGTGDPSSKLKVDLQFGDVGSGVGQTCKNPKSSRASAIPRVAWLPNSAGSGLLKGLAFSAKGDNVDLPISEADDTRWLVGSNKGDMLITVVPETRK